MNTETVTAKMVAMKLDQILERLDKIIELLARKSIVIDRRKHADDSQVVNDTLGGQDVA